MSSDSEGDTFVPSPMYAAYLACREAYRSGDQERIAEAQRHYNQLWVTWHGNGHRSK